MQAFEIAGTRPFKKKIVRIDPTRRLGGLGEDHPVLLVVVVGCVGAQQGDFFVSEGAGQAAFNEAFARFDAGSPVATFPFSVVPCWLKAPRQQGTCKPAHFFAGG